MRDFAAVAAEIIRNDPDLAACAPAVEKELLHHELLGAMSEAGFLRRLVFKGGIWTLMAWWQKWRERWPCAA